MKSNDVHRAVKKRRVERVAGDPPGLGRMSRMPSTGLSPDKQKRERRRHQRERMRQRNVIVAWSALIAVLTLGVLGGFLWFWLSGEVRRGALAGQQQARGLVVEQRVEARFPAPTQEQALAWVKGGLQVRDPGQVSEFFHLGSASPEGVADGLREIETRDGAITDYRWLSSMNANGLLIEGVLVMTEAGGKARSRLALLTPDDEGKWKMDFDAFARTVRPAWSEIMGEAGGQGLVRILFAKDSYFNGPYQDETRWDCYGMASPDQEEVLLGYCLKDTPQARAMAQIMANKRPFAAEGNLCRATLEIRREAGGESRQFEITRVWAADWVMSATAFDETFQ